MLFSQAIPSQNLGFFDSKAKYLDISVGGHDFTISQSPTILSSTRDGGTTGAGDKAFRFCGWDRIRLTLFQSFGR